MSKVTKISPATLNDMLKDKKVYLVDVREDSEFEAEHIAEAHPFPKSTLNPDAIFKAAGKDASICVQCLAGGRSAQSAAVLEDELSKTDAYGDVKLYDLVGGINAWKEAGLPTTH
ncbi:Rhodanese-like domain containing protein, putative [Angomonas deanei]|uniref:Rhodanese-like domain containing protein, putative n=1 Tax=Angomonas deanei TaxID=59799 RepID=A0A7G2CLR0_9TRYP|nr:Rhodanese-like domain containing protein, putative [Angomonas deanei]